MRRLILMRHAEAAAETGTGDHARPLTSQGWREARQAGEALAEVGLPQFALVSDSRRTRETFEVVQDQLSVDVPHRFSRELYGASPRVILAATCDVPPTIRCLLIIGHNPGIADLVSMSSRDGSDDVLVAQAAHFATACFRRDRNRYPLRGARAGWQARKTVHGGWGGSDHRKTDGFRKRPRGGIGRDPVQPGLSRIDDAGRSEP